MTEPGRSRQAAHQQKLVELGCCQRCGACRGCGQKNYGTRRAMHAVACVAVAKYARLCEACMVSERERQAEYRKRKARARVRAARRNAARRAKRRAA